VSHYQLYVYEIVRRTGN